MIQKSRGTRQHSFLSWVTQIWDVGYKGETNEEIIDGWFKDVARTILTEQGHDPQREAGHIKIVPRKDGKSEAS